ncbi:MAG: hypothetical protein PHD97_00630 [Bacteroidales bacterium]|nr:hypothetical protein [Bacteroidales bacterium]
MKKHDRILINKEQINRFFSSYYSEWRHIQIYGIKKILGSKYTFYKEIIEEIKETDNSVGDKTISQEISNGLIFEAIQHSLQYVEDLFALINASKNQDYFIKNIIQYRAGKIEASIKNFKLTKENICASFHFPNYPEDESQNYKEKETLKVIYDSVERLGTILNSIIEFYKKHKFFYNQYKHGLSIAFRPYGDYTPEQIEEDKKENFKRPAIVALDSLNFKDASQNQYGNKGYLMMPCFSDNIRPHLKQLQEENNLLRFVMSPQDTNIDSILKNARMTKKCLQIFIHNFLEVVNDKNPMMLRMPAPNDSEVYEFNIKADENKTS